jgi:hypothetical protein
MSSRLLQRLFVSYPLLLFFLYSLCFFACETSVSEKIQQDSFSAVDTLAGKQLAQTHCGRCHQFPEPSLLDSSSWSRYVLPRMAHVLGIMSEDSSQRFLTGNTILKDSLKSYGYFPDQPLLSESEWQQLKAYYLNLAPSTLLEKISEDLPDELPLFRAIIPAFRLSPPGTSMIRIEQQKIWLGDVHQQMIYQFDASLQLQQAAKVNEGAVDLEMNEEAMLLTVMGSFSPSDVPEGYVLHLPHEQSQQPKKLIKGLKRPVDSQVHDLNQDGWPDLLISEYGQWNGQLAWWENLQGKAFRPHVLKKPAAPINTWIRDIQQDGLPDIIALFGQGDEGIWAFINEGNGQFSPQLLMRFPPSYGSSKLRLADFDQDGDEDLIYTAGDHADYPSLPKPYHGIHIFLNVGNYQFKTGPFLPLPGAYDAIVADFDQDGDTDIAAISFFPDYRKQQALGFVYFEQEKDGHFRPRTFDSQPRGRWLVMDAGDLDGDGDLDLALGSMAFETVPETILLEEWITEGIPFIVLENLLK